MDGKPQLFSLEYRPITNLDLVNIYQPNKQIVNQSKVPPYLKPIHMSYRIATP